MPNNLESNKSKSKLPLEDLHSEIKEFQRKLNFIDSLCRSGETPDEIESEVHAAAKSFAVLLSAYFNTIQVPSFPLSLAEPFAKDLFNFTYLGFEERSRSIVNLSKNKVINFLESVSVPLGENRAEFAYCMALVAEASFRTLEFIGSITKIQSKLDGVSSFRNTIRKEEKLVSHSPKHCH